MVSYIYRVHSILSCSVSHVPSVIGIFFLFLQSTDTRRLVKWSGSCRTPHRKHAFILFVREREHKVVSAQLEMELKPQTKL